MASPTIEPLELDGNVEQWFQRMEAIKTVSETYSSEGSSIDDKTFAIATLGRSAMTLLQDLLYPDTIAGVSYDKIKTTLVEHLSKKRLELSERAMFYTMTQKPGETIANFYTRLKKASENCNFRTYLSDMLRDRLVLGCSCNAAKRKLLQIEELDLDDALKLLQASEVVDASNSLMNSSQPTMPVDFLKKRTKPDRQCYRCGQAMHSDRSQCPAIGKSCTKCHKPNHFAKVCRSRPSTGVTAKPKFEPNKTRRAHYVNDDDAMPTFHIEAIPCHAISSTVIPVSCNGHNIKMEVDTGSSATLISLNMWRGIGAPQLSPSSHVFTAYDGHRICPAGEFFAVLAYKEKSVHSKVTVVKAERTFGLLGRDVIDALIDLPKSMHHTEEATDYLPTVKVPPVKIELVDGARPTFCKARPVPLPLEELVDKSLCDLERKGVIKPVSSSAYASPVVWIRKPDGSLRMTADFKVFLNGIVKADSYPIPNLETIFAGMEGARSFAKIDLKEAYFQFPLDRESQEICTLNTTKGLYRLTRLPKGLKNSSAIFQRTMENVLKGLKGVIIYQDDLLLHGKDDNELTRRLTAVTKRLEDKGFTINVNKSVFLAKEIKFLGYLISDKGISPDPSTKEKLQKCQPPRNRSELESFLGFLNFYGRMIPNFAEIVNPLNSLRKQGVPFVWTQHHQTAFETLLKCITSDNTVLRPYSLKEEVVVTTDASEHAIGGVLSQSDKPVICVSRSLSSAERNYSNVEREGLAIIWTLERLRQLLLGRSFKLITDHRPLLKIFGGNSLPKVVSSRLTRWASRLQAFDYTVIYKPGTDIPHADALTRLRFPSDEDMVVNSTKIVPAVPSDILNKVTFATESDRLSCAIRTRIVKGRWSNCSQREMPFKRLKESLTVEDGLIFMGTRLYVPYVCRKDVFDEAHCTHAGIQSTSRRISLCCWWPSLSKDVQKWIQNCEQCATIRPKPGRDIFTWRKEDQPFKRVHMDFCYVPNVGNILVLVDSYSGWIEAFPLKDRTSNRILHKLNSFAIRFGFPETLVSDNAQEFVSTELNAWCQRNGVLKKESPPYHPQSNGAAERAVQVIKAGLRAWPASNTNFKAFLQRILLQHRSSSRRSDGRSPAEVVFGRRMRVPLSSRSFGTTVIYKPNNVIPSKALTYLTSAGSNTSWLLDRARGELKLAHENQLGATIPEVQPEGATVQEDAAPLTSNNDQDSTEDIAPVQIPRRSTRTRRQRVLTQYDDL